MNVQEIKSGYAFSRNPIILREDFPENPDTISGGNLELMYGGSTIYEGRFSNRLSMDVAEVVDAVVSFFPEPPTDNALPVCQIEDIDGMADREVCCRLDFGSYGYLYKFHAIPGGVSRQNHKRLLQLGKDVFQARFLNPGCNFFLTTRTSSWRIVIRETELYPLYFLMHASGDQIRIVEAVSGAVYEEDGLDEGVAVLDIEAVRKYFVSKKQVLASEFDIYYNSVFSCRIVVERCDPAKERYRLKFRNSLGVFEIIELVGELAISSRYEESEDARFKRHDPDTGGFYSDRERVERAQTVAINTGVKNIEEARFLMDMLGSEEVYLLDMTPLPVKVIPTAEDLSYRKRPESPQRFEIKLEISSSEENIMQDIIDGRESRKPRIFSNHFSKQFN